MYPSQLPPGHPPPAFSMTGEQMVYFTNSGNGPFVPCPSPPTPYGPPVSYGIQYSGIPQPGLHPQVMNCHLPFGSLPPPHWQQMGPAMPMFGMPPPPRQPMPYQSAYTAPTSAPPPMYMNSTPVPPQPYGQPFRSAGPAPYMMATYPGDDVFILHPEVVPTGSYGYPTVPVRGPMQPACFPPPQHNQGVSFISQHPPNMHSMQQPPLIQFSGMHPMGPQQMQSGTFHQQPFVTERVHHRKTERDTVLVTSRVSQSCKAHPTSRQRTQVTQPTGDDAELAHDPSTLPTSPTSDDSVEKIMPSDVTPPCIPETHDEEEESFSDREIVEEQSGNDSLDSDETLVDQFGCSASQTTLIVSPSSSDGSLTLRSSPVTPQMSDDDMVSTVTDDEIPTKDLSSTSFDECQQADNIAQRDLDEETKRCDIDDVSKPEAVMSKKETQPAFQASQQCYVLSGRFASHIPSRTAADRQRNGFSSTSSYTEGKPCRPHRKPKQTNTAFVHQKPHRIRSHIDRPVFQEKASRILTAQAPRPNSPGKESGDNQHNCVRPHLTTHFRLLFEPIPQHPKKVE